MSNFTQRAIMALTLGPLALYLTYRGGLFYFIPVSLILLLATIEYGQLTRKLSLLPSIWILGASSIAFYIAAQWADSTVTAVIMVTALLLSLLYSLWLYETRDDGIALPTWMVMVGGVVLLGWLTAHFFHLRGIEPMGWQWTVLVFVSTWVADGAAYVVGKFMTGKVLGKHHLSPRLSPNKTVEGYVGGILIGTAITALTAYFLQLPIWVALVIGILISTLGPIGDLGISLLKREAGEKDSGTTFRSHGGALDRIDTLMWNTAIAFYVITFFVK
jgi:phosphatidate cytidylyltransferase